MEGLLKVAVSDRKAYDLDGRPKEGTEKRDPADKDGVLCMDEDTLCVYAKWHTYHIMQPSEQPGNTTTLPASIYFRFGEENVDMIGKWVDSTIVRTSLRRVMIFGHDLLCSKSTSNTHPYTHTPTHTHTYYTHTHAHTHTVEAARVSGAWSGLSG
jgi:hypothetical protein